MIVFFFANASMTGLLLLELSLTYHFQVWTGTYEDVLPYVRNAFGRAVAQFASHVPENIREELTQIVIELCDPEPRLRGNFAARNAGKIFMQKYITKLDVLSYKSERGLLDI